MTKPLLSLAEVKEQRHLLATAEIVPRFMFLPVNTMAILNKEGKLAKQESLSQEHSAEALRPNTKAQNLGSNDVKHANRAGGGGWGKIFS
jgi:hypothetical protein